MEHVASHCSGFSCRAWALGVKASVTAVRRLSSCSSQALDGEGNGNPLQYSCLENSTDRGAWQATVHGVTRVGHNLETKPPPPGSRAQAQYLWCMGSVAQWHVGSSRPRNRTGVSCIASCILYHRVTKEAPTYTTKYKIGN